MPIGDGPTIPPTADDLSVVPIILSSVNIADAEPLATSTSSKALTAADIGNPIDNVGVMFVTGVEQPPVFSASLTTNTNLTEAPLPPAALLFAAGAALIAAKRKRRA